MTDEAQKQGFITAATATLWLTDEQAAAQWDDSLPFAKLWRLALTTEREKMLGLARMILAPRKDDLLVSVDEAAELSVSKFDAQWKGTGNE